MPGSSLSLRIPEFKEHLLTLRLLYLWARKQRKILIQLQNLEKLQEIRICLQVRNYQDRSYSNLPFTQQTNLSPQTTASKTMGANIYCVIWHLHVWRFQGNCRPYMLMWVNLYANTCIHDACMSSEECQSLQQQFVCHIILCAHVQHIFWKTRAHAVAKR